MVEADVSNMKGWSLIVPIVLTMAILACVPWILSKAVFPKPLTAPTMKMVTPSSVGF